MLQSLPPPGDTISSNHVAPHDNHSNDDGPNGQRHYQKEDLPQEVHCILGIFSDCIGKLEMAAILPPILLLNSQCQFEDQELIRLLNKHQLLEQKLEMFEWHAQGEGDAEGVGEGEEEEVREEEGDAEGREETQKEGEVEEKKEGEVEGGEKEEVKKEGEVDGKKEEALEGNEEKEAAVEGRDDEKEDEEDEESHQAMLRLEEEIKNSLRDLIRFLRARPETVSAWKAEHGEELGLSERALIRELSVFQNHIVDKWLSSTHEEPQLPPPAMEVSSTDQDEEYMVLMQCLAVEMKEVDTKISDKNHEIENLQRSLEDKKVKANLLAKQHQSILETSDLTIQKIQQNVNEVSVQLKKLIRENRQGENTLHEKNSKMERDTETLLQDFDDEIEEIQANLEQNEYKYELELEELHKVESRVAALQPEYDAVMKKRQLAEEKKQEMARQLKLKTRAALIAQSWWRGYCVRKALAGKKGKGKKDKKKGKKK